MNTTHNISFNSDDFRSFSSQMLLDTGADQKTIDEILDNKTFPVFIAKELSAAYLSDSVLVAAQSMQLIHNQEKIVNELSTQLDIVRVKVDKILSTLENIIENGVVIVDPDSPSTSSDTSSDVSADISTDISADISGSGGEDEPTTQFNVVFYFMDDGQKTVLKQQSVQKGEDAEEPAEDQIPVKSGYSFTGWSRSFTDVNEDLEIEAVYEANIYRITFDPGEGTVDVQSKDVEYDQIIGDLPVPVREGYDFISWQIDPNQNINEDMIMKIYNDITVYAVWQIHEDVDPGTGDEPSTNPDEPSGEYYFDIYDGYDDLDSVIDVDDSAGVYADEDLRRSAYSHMFDYDWLNSL